MWISKDEYERLKTAKQFYDDYRSPLRVMRDMQVHDDAYASGIKAGLNKPRLFLNRVELNAVAKYEFIRGVKASIALRTDKTPELPPIGVPKEFVLIENGHLISCVFDNASVKYTEATHIHTIELW